MKKSVIVYWLIPARPERELFRSLIRILAKQFEAPVFGPHLTLGFAKDRQPRNQRGSRSVSDSPTKLLRRIKGSPVRLHVRGTAYSSKFTKTLFVQLKRDRALDRLTAALGSSGPRDPHMSLLYKKLPARVKKQLVATIKLPFRTVKFDAIKAVRCLSPTTTVAEVKSWRVVAIRRMG